MTNEGTLTRKVMRNLPMGAAVAGMIVILGSIVFFFETDYWRIAVAAGGMLLLLGAIWYAANPFLKNQRQYLPLRREVDKFIKLASQLNSAAVEGRPEQVEQIRSAMHESIDGMAEAAGKAE